MEFQNRHHLSPEACRDLMAEFGTLNAESPPGDVTLLHGMLCSHIEDPNVVPQAPVIIQTLTQQFAAFTGKARISALESLKIVLGKKPDAARAPQIEFLAALLKDDAQGDLRFLIPGALAGIFTGPAAGLDARVALASFSHLLARAGEPGQEKGNVPLLREHVLANWSYMAAQTYGHLAPADKAALQSCAQSDVLESNRVRAAALLKDIGAARPDLV